MSKEIKVFVLRQGIFFLSLFHINCFLIASAHVRYAELPQADPDVQERLPREFTANLPDCIEYLRIHRDLAEKQNSARELFKTHKPQNLVIGSVSIVVQKKDAQKFSKTFPILYVFESRIDYSKDSSTIFTDQDKVKEFTHQFEQSVTSFAELVKHLRDCIGNQNDRKANEILQQIRGFYDQEKEFSAFVQNMHFSISKSLTQLLPYSEGLPETRVELHRRGLFNPPNQRHSRGMRSEYDHRNDAILKLKDTFNLGIKKIEDFERSMRAKFTEFYNKFWHSEQRCMYHLLNVQNDDIDEGAETNIYDKIHAYVDDLTADQTTVGLVVHLHSKYEPCPVCRFLIESSLSNLRKKFAQEQLLDNEDFLNVAITYDVRYRVEGLWVASFQYDGEYEDTQE